MTDTYRARSPGHSSCGQHAAGTTPDDGAALAVTGRPSAADGAGAPARAHAGGRTVTAADVLPVRAPRAHAAGVTASALAGLR